jgi:puromycin-sensitive aminopeptidase
VRFFFTSLPQIDEIFDAISYQKGASVVNMLFTWIGEENFKLGMNRSASAM